MNPENIHPIFENLTSFEIIKLDYRCIKVSPDEGFRTIANILGELHAHECINPKKRLLFQKLTSQIMGRIYWTHLIWLICQETTNNQILSSTCSLWYNKDDHWKYENIPPNAIFKTKY
eukprot:412295_1